MITFYIAINMQVFTLSMLEKAGVSAWRVTRKRTEAVELYFIKKKLDLPRYKDLDEILADMITDMRKDYNFIDKIDEALNSNGSDASFEKTVHAICDILSDIMEKHLLDIQKINFDLTVLAINEPDRAEKIIGQTRSLRPKRSDSRSSFC